MLKIFDCHTFYDGTYLITPKQDLPMSAPTKPKHKKSPKTKVNNSANRPLSLAEVNKQFSDAKTNFDELSVNIVAIETNLATYLKDVNATPDTYSTDKVALVDIIQTTLANISKCKGTIGMATNKILSRSGGFQTPEDGLAACFSIAEVHMKLLEMVEVDIFVKHREIVIMMHDYFKKLYPPGEVA